MISALKAKDIIEKHQRFKVKTIRDLNDSWVINVDVGNPPMPGIPSYLIHKDSAIVKPFFATDDFYIELRIAAAPIVWQKK